MEPKESEGKVCKEEQEALTLSNKISLALIDNVINQVLTPREAG